ncbi:MAG: exonuclease domain-containing protein, partial [Eubacteriales bacterium]
MENSKTLSAAFPRCHFSAESREFADKGFIRGNLRVAKEARAVEADVSFSFFVPYKKIFAAEREILEAYSLNYVKIYPKYDPALFCDACIPDILYEAQRTDAVSRSFLPKATFERNGNKITIHLMVGSGAVDFVKRAQMEKKIASIIMSEYGIKTEIEFTQSNEADVLFDDLIQSEMQRAYKRTFSDSEVPPDNRKEPSNGNTAVLTPVAAEQTREKSKMRTTILDEVKEAYIDNDGYLHAGFSVFDISEPRVIYGKNFSISPVNISKMNRAMPEVTVAGEIFGVTSREMKKKGNYSVSFGITDKNGSITVKKLVSTERGEGEFLSLTDGMVLAIEGKYEFDEFENENVLIPFSVMEVKKLPRTDNAPEKRVELHLHTTMSTMDATIPPDVAVKTAYKFGHRAIGITDHANVQGFPEAMLAAEKLGMKVLYGLEAYFVDDTARAIYGDDSASFNDEFVAFDIETTGLSPISCHITEIGAVIVKNDVVLDRFQTFVDPETPIPAKIVELTGITDEMVAGAPKAAQAVADFIKFIGDRMLIAHNASFDISFIRKVAEDNGIPFNNPYLDTVAMSRFANPDLSKHKLDIVAKYFNIGDFNHHRASDDAEMASKIFYRMVEKLAGEGVYTPSQMSLAMNKSTDPLSLKTYHIILYAQNAVGLKNLYKIVSKSYLDYFKRYPRVPRTVLEAHREGIIIGSACEAGQLYSALLEDKPWDELLNMADFYDYLEIQPLCNNIFLVENGTVSSVETLKDINRKIIKLGDTLGKPVVATCDAHFLNYEDEIYRKVLLAGLKYSDADRDIHLYFRNTEE